MIQLPFTAAFAEAGSYNGTALHELTHWTGHESRCNRVLAGRQHIESYAFEELVAELDAAFLSSHCGIPGELQHPSYIASWLQALKCDKRLIFKMPTCWRWVLLSGTIKTRYRWLHGGYMSSKAKKVCCQIHSNKPLSVLAEQNMLHHKPPKFPKNKPIKHLGSKSAF